VLKQLKHFINFFMKKNKIIIIELLFIILIIVFFISIFQGYSNITYKEVIKLLLNKIGFYNNANLPEYVETIIIIVRLPRIILAILIGAALAVSGCVMQGIFRNVMAGPYTTGIASGASFGAALFINFGFSLKFVTAGAFLFSIFTAFFVYLLAVKNSYLQKERLILSGMVISLFFSSLVSFIQYLSSDPNLREIIFWIMGGFWKANWHSVKIVLPIILILIILLNTYYRELNALLLSEEEAKSLGINCKKVRMIILIFSSLLTASAVSVSGIIAFIGLICPHIMRLIIGSDNKYLLIASALAGSILLLITDTLSRSIVYPVEIPVGILTSLLGVPFFIFLLKRHKKSNQIL